VNLEARGRERLLDPRTGVGAVDVGADVGRADTRMGHLARPEDRSAVVGDADGDLTGLVYAGKDVAVSPAVLERGDDCVVGDEGPRRLRRRRSVVALDEEDDEVAAADRHRVVSGSNPHRPLASVLADDREAVAIDLLDERAGDVDEHRVVAALEEACAEDAAHGTGTHDRDLHGASLTGRRSYNVTRRG
jgi:hypothetical protein